MLLLRASVGQSAKGAGTLVVGYLCVHVRARVRACMHVCMEFHSSEWSARVVRTECTTHQQNGNARHTDVLVPTSLDRRALSMSSGVMLEG